ncbi:MAG: hypothetical protein JNK75_11895 [Betaproteobacteria bacterium]|nr:hypothetical protein [Betaproteobacteria bacterium]
MLQRLSFGTAVRMLRQRSDRVAPVVLVNIINAAPAGIPALLKARESGASRMKVQPAGIPEQSQRGIAGNTMCVNYAR